MEFEFGNRIRTTYHMTSDDGYPIPIGTEGLIVNTAGENAYYCGFNMLLQGNSKVVFATALETTIIPVDSR